MRFERSEKLRRYVAVIAALGYLAICFAIPDAWAQQLSAVNRAVEYMAQVVPAEAVGVVVAVARLLRTIWRIRNSRIVERLKNLVGNVL